MNVSIRVWVLADLPAMTAIWNEVVEEGIAFPQEEPLTADSAAAFFRAQTYVAVAADADSGKVVGLYILHPNNVGRCGHICNASYAVASSCRGQHVGKELVKDCLAEAGKHGFRVLQFNAVVATNIHARHLYERLGFHPLGTIKGGFRMKDGHYEDICPYWRNVPGASAPNDMPVVFGEGFVTPPQHVHFRAKKLPALSGTFANGALAYLDPGGGGPTEKHTHPHDHLFLVIEGEARIELGDRIVLVKPGETFRVPGRIPHSVWNNAPVTTIMLGLTIPLQSTPA